MKTIVQTLLFSAAFATAGSVVYEEAAHYASRSERRVPLRLPQGHPGIPDNIKTSLHDAFSGK